MKSYEEIICAVVEGQIRSFLNDHPEVVDSGVTTWKQPPGKAPDVQLLNSLAKRINRDLTCADTKGRISRSLHVSRGDEPR